jgi:hypothetical protein
MTTVRIVKNWDWPDILRQTPGCKGIWDGVNFTLDDVNEYDFAIVFNNFMKTDTQVICPETNLWALMQEPYESGFSDWMVEKHEVFYKVFTHHIPFKSPKYIASHPAIPWHVNLTFDELIACKMPVKSRKLSGIVGEAMDLPGHIKRWKFLEYIQKDTTLELDLYGRKINYIEDKWNGLAPYKYSLAIENNSGPDCWTEKLADCFLTWTVPLYYGCTNLEKYFPKESFIRIDINNPLESLNKIKAIINENNWERYIPALEEARNLVLYRYQFFPYFCELIRSQPVRSTGKKRIIVPAYKRSRQAWVNRFKYKFRKKLGLLT